MIDLAGALALAARANLRVRFADLGTWGGRAALLAEYDAAARAIVIDARMAKRLIESDRELGERFVTLAVLHELHHHAAPGADEAAAHRFARRLSGYDPLMVESLVRSRRVP